MIYALLWRGLPGPKFVKLLLSLALFLAFVAFCFVWLFPRIAPFMPFNDNTVDPSGSAGHATHQRFQP